MPPPEARDGNERQPDMIETIKGPCYTVKIKWNAERTAWRVIHAVYNFTR